MKQPENLQTHPYMQRILEPQLIFHKRKLECLQKRLVLIDNGLASKSDYQRNEDEITKIKTVVEIETMRKVIGEREGYYILFLKQFLADVEAMEKDYASVVAKAQKSENPEIQSLVSQLEFTVVGANQINIEAKVHFYKRLVNLLK